MKFEYSVIDYGGFEDPKGNATFTTEAVQGFLNDLGKDGWELVKVIETGLRFRFYMKRQKP